MLLKQYLLLNLGTIGLADALEWLDHMSRRRRADASRDLLAFWEPREPGEAVLPGQLIAYAVIGLDRSATLEPVARLVTGLQEAARRGLWEFGIAASPIPGHPGLQVYGRSICAMVLTAAAGLVTARLRLDLNTPPRPGAVSLATLRGRPVQPAAAAGAVAYHFEQVLGYEPAIHPLAREESMHGQGGVR